MSKDFLTLKDAANRLGSSSSTNMNFIHKDEAILSGSDPTPLSSYSLTAPPYSLEAAKQEAYKTGEMLKMKKEFADWFTQNYKKYFPGFKNE